MYSPTFCFCKTSANKWVSRKSKPKLRRRNQGKARRKQQELDGRTSHAPLHIVQYQTHKSMGDTLFSLTYGTQAVILAEIGMPTLRTATVDMVENDEALEINLDLLEERREQATIREAKSKAKIEKYYNSKLRSTSFKPGDLVYRSNDASRAKEVGKLSPK
ncbi:hypothetical protein Tco_1277739 [Tanacetum coccineum]